MGDLGNDAMERTDYRAWRFAGRSPAPAQGGVIACCMRPSTGAAGGPFTRLR
jgi:hypothetical protein